MKLPSEPLRSKAHKYDPDEARNEGSLIDEVVEFSNERLQVDSSIPHKCQPLALATGLVSRTTRSKAPG
jgi:hypothetical protein